MRIKTFVIGYVLALALLLFAQQRHTDLPPASGFRGVVDLVEFPEDRHVMQQAMHDEPSEVVGEKKNNGENDASHDARFGSGQLG